MIVITCSIGRVDSSMKFNTYGSSMESSSTNTTDQILLFYGNVIDIKGTMKPNCGIFKQNVDGTRTLKWFDWCWRGYKRSQC